MHSIGTRKQLFIDQRFIVDGHDVALVVNPPAKAGPINVEAVTWPCVVEHAGTCYLYQGCNGPTSVWTSADGIAWTTRGRVDGVDDASGLTSINSVFIDPKDGEYPFIGLYEFKPQAGPRPGETGAPVTVVALDLAGQVEADPLPGLESDGSLLLPAHLARLSGPVGMRLGPAGAVQGWTNANACLAWRARFHRPGRFRVLVQSHVDRDRQQDFGDHLVRVTIGKESVAGLVGRRDLSMDPAVNHWQAVAGEIGEIAVGAVGELDVTLRAERLDPAAREGLTACGILLLPGGAAKAGAGGPIQEGKTEVAR